MTYSLSPAGESFALPAKADYTDELKRIEELVRQARSEMKEIVVVMGLGFVGAVMAAIVADTKNKNGKNSKFVIGCQRPSPTARRHCRQWRSAGGRSSNGGPVTWQSQPAIAALFDRTAGAARRIARPPARHSAPTVAERRPCFRAWLP